MNAESIRYYRYRFPPLIISRAVWLYRESDLGRKTAAEGVEGRLLIEENTHQSGTHPTQSGARVSLGLAGCAASSKSLRRQLS